MRILMTWVTAVCSLWGAATAQEGLLVATDDGQVPVSFTEEELNAPGRLCIRFNNYWCIKGAGWRGETGRDDRGHAIFSDASFGARAFFYTMRSYRFRYDIKTTRQIFARYAPSSDCVGSLPRDPETGLCPQGENPTVAYARTVAEAMGIGLDDDIGLFDTARRIDVAKAKKLARGVLRFEIGQQYDVTDTLLDEGIALAGIEPMPGSDAEAPEAAAEEQEEAADADPTEESQDDDGEDSEDAEDSGDESSEDPDDADGDAPDADEEETEDGQDTTRGLR